MPRRCDCRLCRSKHNNQESDSDSQVCREAWAPQEDLLRQRDEFRGSQQRAEGASGEVPSRPRNRGGIRCLVERAVQLHSSEGASFRRAVGSCRKTGEVPASTSCRQSAADARRDGHSARRSRGGAKQSPHSTAVSRPQRRRSSDTRAPTNRSGSAFAAARIRRRRQRQQGEVLQALADALRSQAEVLAGLVEGLRPRTTGQGQVAQSPAQHRGRSTSPRARGQSATSRVGNRPNTQRHRGTRRKGQGGGNKNKDGHI
ncbi:uncharacterized protein LOC133330127 [Musca vetustissima]|uniref:uncharacterized protein LOC133330127 n=1 Tax=Musca vetustissima TaxID=27455 RepID=UPI002AB7D132|nr:uncharacterized protein LOC133330127 [Musca vetustissima]